MQQQSVWKDSETLLSEQRTKEYDILIDISTYVLHEYYAEILCLNYSSYGIIRNKCIEKTPYVSL